MDQNKDSNRSENARLLKRLHKLRRERVRLERRNRVIVYIIEKYAEILGERLPGPDQNSALLEFENEFFGSSLGPIGLIGSDPVFDSCIKKKKKTCLFCPKSFETDERMAEHVKVHLAPGSK